MAAQDSPPDLDCRFVAAVAAIYGTALEPARWPEALQAIADCTEDVGAVMLHQRDDGSLGTIISTHLSAAAQAEYERTWWREDIRSFRAVERGLLVATDAITDRHVVTPEEIETHPIYTDYLIPNGFGWVAAVGICPDPSRLVWISVQRARRKPPFADDELALLTSIGRHAEKALRLSLRVLDAELAQIGLGEALARIGIGVFALDSLARVVFSNPAGERLLRPYMDDFGGRLRIRGTADRAAANIAIDQAVRAEPQDLLADPKPVLLHRPDVDRPLVLYFLPVLSPVHPAEQFLTHTRAILLVIDSQSADPPDPALVRDMFGLTLGEARIAALVGTGAGTREAAARLGVTEETIRTVLKRVYAKMGLSRQSELVALLSRIVVR